MNDFELEINENDSSIDTRSIPANRPCFRRGLAGFLTVMMLFSGSVLAAVPAYAAEFDTEQSQSAENPNQVIEIDKSQKYEIARLCGKTVDDDITIGDLRSINDTFLTMAVDDDSNLEWLQYIGNVDFLSIVIHASSTDVFKSIDKLGGIKSLSLFATTPSDFTKENFSFLKKSKSTTELHLTGMHIEPGILEELTHLKSLIIMSDDGNLDFDITKLTFLDTLDFSITGPYTAVLDITSEEMETLEKAGVKIKFSNDGDLDKFYELDQRLDEIVTSLGVNKDSTDEEKLYAIVSYVINNLTYDPEVSAAIRDNIEHRDLTHSFYTEGLLYGAFEKDTAICGNYAALTNALAERLDLDHYYLVSSNHAWSLIDIDGELFYVDPTWLDSQVVAHTVTETITEGNLTYTQSTTSFLPAEEGMTTENADSIPWYKEDPTSHPDEEISHNPINLPCFIKLKPIASEKEDIPETTIEATEPTPTETIPPTENREEETTPIKIDPEQEYELSIGSKKLIVTGAVAVGVLAGLGGTAACLHKRKKDRERRERQRREYDSMFSPYEYTDFGNPHGGNYGDYGSYQPPRNNNSSKRGRR